MPNSSTLHFHQSCHIVTASSDVPELRYTLYRVAAAAPPRGGGRHRRTLPARGFLISRSKFVNEFRDLLSSQKSSLDSRPKKKRTEWISTREERTNGHGEWVIEREERVRVCAAALRFGGVGLDSTAHLISREDSGLPGFLWTSLPGNVGLQWSAVSDREERPLCVF